MPSPKNESAAADSGTTPAPGHWSATQVVHHLLFIEGNIIQYVQKKILADEALPGVSLFTRLRARAVRLFLRRVVIDRALPLELKVPNAETMAAMRESRAMLAKRRSRLPGAEPIFDAP